MDLILVVVISAGMAENSQNGVSRSLRYVSGAKSARKMQLLAELPSRSPVSSAASSRVRHLRGYCCFMHTALG